MNIDQFRALKPGDRIENPMGASTGEVTAIDETGVTVRWDGNVMTRRFSVVGTAWFHWTLAEKVPTIEEARAEWGLDKKATAQPG